MTFEEQIDAQLAVMLTPEQRKFFGTARATGLSLNSFIIWSVSLDKSKVFAEYVGFTTFDDPDDKDTLRTIRRAIGRCSLKLQLALID